MVDDARCTITRMDALTRSGLLSLRRNRQTVPRAPLPAHAPHRSLQTALLAILEKAEFFGNEVNCKSGRSGGNWLGRR